MKMIIRRRKILHFFELRHGFELSVKLEYPAMITAAQVGHFTGFIHQQVAPVGTYIGKTMQLRLCSSRVSSNGSSRYFSNKVNGWQYPGPFTISVSPANCQERAKIFSFASSKKGDDLYTSVEIVCALDISGSTKKNSMSQF